MAVVVQDNEKREDRRVEEFTCVEEELSGWLT